MNGETHVVIFSGGLDSTVLLHRAILGMDADRVRAVSVDYGQRHGAAELNAARRIAKSYGIIHDVIDLSPLGKLLPGSSQTDESVPVPLGHYEDETMRKTVVPNRNMIFIAVAASICAAHGGGDVHFGSHGGDHAIYPDCRERFLSRIGDALGLCDCNHVGFQYPFVGYLKSDIVKFGSKIGAPMEKSWSCYQGGAEHCGACGTCIERREAFIQANVPDPTKYAPDAPSMASLLEILNKSR